MKKTIFSGIVFLLILTMLSACNLPASSSQQPTTNPEVVFTAAAQTVEAQLNANTPIPEAPTSAPPEQPTQAPPTAEAPAQPTATNQPEPTATSIPCDIAEFVEDVTIPDDSVFAPNEVFTKTWRLKNAGTCTWNTSYSLVFDSGNAFGAPAAIALPGDVAPGQTVDISVDFKAPADGGTYTGYWKLKNSSSVLFGLGDEHKSFWVRIKVQEATDAPFAVTAASFTLNPATFNGVCPTNITFVGKITTNGPGTVVYTYRREDGFISPEMTVNFDAAGEKNLVDYTMSIDPGAGSSWSGKVWLYINTPNHQEFGKKDLSITCAP